MPKLKNLSAFEHQRRKLMMAKSYIDNNGDLTKTAMDCFPQMTKDSAKVTATRLLKQKDVQYNILRMTGLIGLNKDFIVSQYLTFLNSSETSEKGKLHCLDKLAAVIGILNNTGNSEPQETNVLNIVNIVAETIKPEQRSTLAPIIEKYNQIQEYTDNQLSMDPDIISGVPPEELQQYSEAIEKYDPLQDFKIGS